MNVILTKGVIRGGQVVLGEPINVPDGTEVMITRRIGDSSFVDEENDRPDTPEEIAADVAAMEAFEAMDMTDAELASWEADRKARKEWEKARFFDRADKIQRQADA